MENLDKKLKNDFSFIEKRWNDSIIPTLSEYIKIPNKSVLFDKDWEAHGYMNQAMQLLIDWCQEHPIKNMKLDLIKDPGRTPLLMIEIPGQSDETVLLYGHMDKQPEMTGWDSDKGPWKPVIQNGRLYGRGAADDGYSTFAAMTAIEYLQKNQIPHARCILLIEASEESGSIDLPHYLESLKDRIGSPSLIVCLDTGAANYEALWSTTSLRGLMMGDLSVQVLGEGMHSGIASGVVPSTFTILQQLLQRIENTANGKIVLKDLYTDIPANRQAQAKETADRIGNDFLKSFAFYEKTLAMESDISELLLNRTWRPTLSITGINGIPSLENAGSVALPQVKVRLSFRVPPTLDAESSQEHIKTILESSPPFNATVKYTPISAESGWDAPELSDWLEAANNQASTLFFGQPAGYLGEGGSIPFMGMLGEMFPQAQFLITGVLGPKSNAHGPNEFLHIDYAKKVTACVAYVVAKHYDSK